MMCSVRTGLLASTFFVSSERALQQRRWAKWGKRPDNFGTPGRGLMFGSAMFWSEAASAWFSSQLLLQRAFTYHPDFDRIGWPG